MADVKTPEQIAEAIEALPQYAGLTLDDLGLSVEEMMIAAIEADRAQRPALEQWTVFEVDYPNSGDAYNCDEETAAEIARAYTAEDREWGCSSYGYRKIGA